MVMVSGACHSGLFAQAVQCGFFAAHPDVVASGCQLSPAALETSDDYLRHFFRAATGAGGARKTRPPTRDPVRRALVCVHSAREPSAQLHDDGRADRRLFREPRRRAARIADRGGDPRRGASLTRAETEALAALDRGARARNPDTADGLRRSEPRRGREARRRDGAVVGRAQPHHCAALQADVAAARAARRVRRVARERSGFRGGSELRAPVAAELLWWERREVGVARQSTPLMTPAARVNRRSFEKPASASS